MFPKCKWEKVWCVCICTLLSLRLCAIPAGPSPIIFPLFWCWDPFGRISKPGSLWLCVFGLPVPTWHHWGMLSNSLRWQLVLWCSTGVKSLKPIYTHVCSQIYGSCRGVVVFFSLFFMQDVSCSVYVYVFFSVFQPPSLTSLSRDIVKLLCCDVTMGNAYMSGEDGSVWKMIGREEGFRIWLYLIKQQRPVLKKSTASWFCFEDVLECVTLAKKKTQFYSNSQLFV